MLFLSSNLWSKAGKLETFTQPFPCHWWVPQAPGLRSCSNSFRNYRAQRSQCFKPAGLSLAFLGAGSGEVRQGLQNSDSSEKLCKSQNTLPAQTGCISECGIKPFFFFFCLHFQVAPIIKERMMKKGSMMLGYQPHWGKVNFFRQVVISPQVSREDMDFLLDEIELLAKDL